MNQTIGLDRIEVIAVDDGSTDGSGRILDEYAARHRQVSAIHEPNSGGPGRPRNAGLDRAAGTYVFFLDGDDYLGPEALERLVAMAERNGSDIVLGKVVGVGGRKVYRHAGAFRRNADRVELEQVYRSSSVQKLFRRSLIERAGLRFREGLARGEDGDFMAALYPEAGTISVLADYDCYFLRQRPGSQTRVPERRDDLAEAIVRLEQDRMQVVAAHRKPGAGRDALMAKHLERLAWTFNRRWAALDADERRRVFDTGAEVARRWLTAGIQRRLPAWAAIRTWCLQHGLLGELEDIAMCPPHVAFRDPVVEGGRIFARYPHFRDGSGIPDAWFEITKRVIPVQHLVRAAVVGGRLELAGEAYLALVGGSTTIELRQWPRGATWRFPTTAVATPDLRDKIVAYPEAGFEVAIDLSAAQDGRPLSRGTWALRLVIETGSISRTVPLRARRREVLDQGQGDGAGIRGAGASSGLAAPGTLSVTPAHVVRLRIGHRRRATAWLERLETAYAGASRFVGRVIRSSPPGRRLRDAAERQSGVAARLIDASTPKRDDEL